MADAGLRRWVRRCKPTRKASLLLKASLAQSKAYLAGIKVDQQTIILEIPYSNSMVIDVAHKLDLRSIFRLKMPYIAARDIDRHLGPFRQ